MTFFNQYHWVIGLLVLAAVLTVMLGTPVTFFGRQTSFIYSNLSDPKSNVTYVRTNMDFGDNDQIREFPMEIGGWYGRDFDVDPWRDQLGADVALLRGYRKPNQQEIWFLAMQSKSRSTFHPPEVCYPAMGWEILEEGFEDIPGEDASWIEAPLFPRFSEAQSAVRLKKIVVAKEKNDIITERRLVVYFYVKHAELGGSSDIITMIRISAIAPLEGSYQDVLDREEDLLLEFIPLMFQPDEHEDIIIVRLAKTGLGGILLIVVSFLVPLGLTLFPQIGKLIRRRRIRAG